MKWARARNEIDGDAPKHDYRQSAFKYNTYDNGLRQARTAYNTALDASAPLYRAQHNNRLSPITDGVHILEDIQRSTAKVVIMLLDILQ